EFKPVIEDKLTLLPIFEYKWKLERLLEQKRREKESLWTRIKNFILRRKSPKKQILDFFDEERIDYMGRQTVRGQPILPKILEIIKKSPQKLDSEEYVKNELQGPPEILSKHEIFGKLDEFYLVSIEFEITDEIFEFLAFRDFIMLDLVQSLDEKKPRINYHSLVITKKDCKDMTFIQATDLHLAERYDRIYELLKQGKRVKKTLKREEQDLIIKERSAKALLKKMKPLERRLKNPNNSFRKFIKLMNEKVRANKLDFIVFTGDLVDFVLLSNLQKEDRTFDYEKCNWRVFKDIVINSPDQKIHDGIVEGEELLCPIFTVLGNHDYRPYHYNLIYLKMYERFGLTHDEAEALEDKLSVSISPFNSLVKNSKTLDGYCAEINPFLNFSVRFGNNLLIFLDSGPDSYINIIDFISGHPSVTGLTNEQISYLENLQKYAIKERDNVFLFLHAPIVNPVVKGRVIKKIKRSLFRRNVILQHLEDFKEFSLSKKLGRHDICIPINEVFNVKHATISSHWDKLLELCKHYTMVLSGHTHVQKEFRIHFEDHSDEDQPCFKIYHDTYSQIFSNPRDIQKFGPYAVQTPALWLDDKGTPKAQISYREIKIVNGKLASFNIVTIY
ncbi:MAG: metallophosphoesterase family protein, partial [Candidatus Helarchaeales archaeon]